MFYTRDKEWYNSIDTMRSLSYADFNLFKKVFFDNTPENQNILAHQDLEVYTFFVLETLDNVVRNRTIDFKQRMEAISLFKFVLRNKNLENESELKYKVNVDISHMIRQFLLFYTQIPDDELVDDDHNLQLRSYATEVLISMFEEGIKGDEEAEAFIQTNKANVRKNFQF